MLTLSIIFLFLPFSSFYSLLNIIPINQINKKTNFINITDCHRLVRPRRRSRRRSPYWGSLVSGSHEVSHHQIKISLCLVPTKNKRRSYALSLAICVHQLFEWSCVFDLEKDLLTILNQKKVIPDSWLSNSSAKRFQYPCSTFLWFCYNSND